MKLTHTDLKPENMLFVDSNYDIEYIPQMVSVLSFLMSALLGLYLLVTIPNLDVVLDQRELETLSNVHHLLGYQRFCFDIYQNKTPFQQIRASAYYD